MQKARNSVFDALLQGNKAHIIDEQSKDAAQNFNDIAIMEIFGRTYQQLLETPRHLYDDIVLILNKRHAIEKKKMEEIEQKNKNRTRR